VEAAIEKSGRRKDIEARRKLRRHFLSGAMVARTLSESSPPALAAEDHQADFQMHSHGSDGSDSVAVLARACRARGYRCMAVTDHSYGLPIAGGMAIDAFRAQHAEIDQLNEEMGGEFHVFKGVEANLLADGSLDLKPEEIPEFDLVVASPHSALRKTVDQTGRMVEAVSRPGVHILGHPRGRIFNLRAGVQADWGAVFGRAAETGVAIELDGDVSRQDLDFELARHALEAGCLFALDSDAHAADQLWMADYAVAHARLAGITRDRVVNCWPVDEILAWARSRHHGRAARKGL
jgi:histidinol phosphatase-like PHP family hydrolase